MYCVGLTGNIASGKSTVSACFAELGIPTINADSIARELTQPGQPALTQIKQRFDANIITVNGELNRKWLRQIIFTNEAQRQWLDELLHPLIRTAIQIKVKELTSDYCLIEIPLLKDKADYAYLNRVLVVLANEETQIQRIIARDHCDKNQALAIIATQPNEMSRKNIADDIIFNNSSRQELSKTVKQLHKKYLQFVNKKSL